MQDNILGVTNYNFNTIDLIQLIPNNVEYKNEIEQKQNLLFQNYPNPFNPNTSIKYKISKPNKVKIEIFNTLGQKIEILLNKNMPAGSHEVECSARDLPNGVYYYKIESGEFQETKKMILMK